MSLELTRKRAKEIKKLRKQADKLWAEQRAVSHHADRTPPLSVCRRGSPPSNATRFTDTANTGVTA